MFLLEWQEVVQKHLSEFSWRELMRLTKLSAIPRDDSSVYTLELSADDYHYLRSEFEEKTSYIPLQLPRELTSLCIQSDTFTGKYIYYFKRLENHPDWYVLDIFQKGRYQCTFLALDTDPLPELQVPFAPFYIPVCILLSRREEMNTNRAFQAFKFAHYLFQQKTAKRE